MKKSQKCLNYQNEVYNKLEITSSQVLKGKIIEKDEQVNYFEIHLDKWLIQEINLQLLIDKSQEILQQQQEQLQLHSPACLKRSNSFEDLQQKLNEYIEQYIQDIKEPQHFLDTYSLQSSEICDDEFSQHSIDLCQRIYQVEVYQFVFREQKLSQIYQSSNPTQLNNQLLFLPQKIMIQFRQ
ncbi:unnamed protein product (macronuclear) [Paramecium tetraurelia]|uniref:Chromosome undetermined scaffold_1, whole genome shotgun sequence n=1 Tax=Paramecium tetraurelia TaxID=5888 RepID=Q6BGJ7_PARTE|nr:hypothetical protein [Paramecium tetraurelia strain d4-2]XP_001423496.1 uncharacterized protein GSPATT00000534001 [Paramecium tetraurelia]CAH03223.1 hypothetical protein PTMB.26c [Paramecium tetraurelia]CAK56098.1 unnamed protein product [Paramecium tetraurelia]|eukprot:XP_001423496.1 hypothetical protein (macronuclear) [Paramecium tetraurelia strain d4-2]